RIIVTIDPRDLELAQICRAQRAEVVLPERPPEDMKRSVLYGLQYIERRYQPSAEAVWLMAPADLPFLSAARIARLLAEQPATPEKILVPRQAGRRGHPILAPWPVAAEVARLPENGGLNALLRDERIRLIDCADDGSDEDLDTPADFARLQNRHPPINPQNS
ncbi:MAG TPA: NTP transferase domain-containing protein, partial [Pirellulales bacterium]|nr:NTP transferase domain-containing protein [Pirellulales bacterium]